jgi:putative ABC transport system permease protein
MNVYKLITVYAMRLVRREWKRFLLPTLSLGITATVLSSTLYLTTASQSLLAEQARILQGGDVALEGTGPLSIPDLLGPIGIQPDAGTEIIEFSSTIQSPDIATAVSLQVVDAAYPLYGEIRIRDGVYAYPNDDEILLDQKASERLNVQVGDTVSMGEGTFVVSGIIESDPTSLFSSFRFLPRALMSHEGFARTSINASLLRAEYEYLFTANLTNEQKSAIRELEVATNGAVQTRIAGEGRGGLQAGLGIVTDFLVVTILITAILAAVNVYASTLYFITAERKSFAILLSLGVTRPRLVSIIASALGLVVTIGSLLGILVGVLVYLGTASYIGNALNIILPAPDFLRYGSITWGLMALLALGAFIPTMHTVLGLQPKQLLIGEERNAVGQGWLFLTVVTIATFTPILGLSVYLLESWYQGFVVVGAVAGMYALIIGLFSVLLLALYRVRGRFPFTVRSLIAQKRADGLFGTASFTSLFVALSVLCTLVLLQSTLERYLTQDLSTTVPSSYVIDIQPSQSESLIAAFPELILNSNTPARIMRIDDTEIQTAIALGDPSVDRELGREFNLTAREALLSSEEVVGGEWHEGRSGEISVDEAFAERANIRLGSEIVFSIQGFEVAGRVTSMRTTDSRSGLPFFFFVLSPQDLEPFPQIFFGYAYHGADRQQELARFLAEEMPNVTVVETTAIAPLLIALTELLLLVVFIVTIPPLLIALLLIITMIISSYAKRRREGGRLRALGATKRYVTTWYIIETVLLTVLAASIAYAAGGLGTYLVSTEFLEVSSVVLFDPLLGIGLLLIIALTALIGVVLVKSDTMPLRELLSYAE